VVIFTYFRDLLILRYSHGGTGSGCDHKPAFSALACVSSFNHSEHAGIFPIEPVNPSEPILDHFLIHTYVRDIYLSDNSPVAIDIIFDHPDLFPEHQIRDKLLWP